MLSSACPASMQYGQEHNSFCPAVMRWQFGLQEAGPWPVAALQACITAEACSCNGPHSAFGNGFDDGVDDLAAEGGAEAAGG